jgi:multiple sugar transport system substrate-binding protein
MSNDHDDARHRGAGAPGHIGPRLTRRQSLAAAGALGLSTSLPLTWAQRALAADSSLLDSAPEAPYESPITPERVAYLKTKPYQGVTINMMVIQATVGDAVKAHAKHWQEQTGATVNVAAVPIETLHQQIFTDLSTGLARYDIYQTGAWFYGDYFVPETPYIISIDEMLKDRKFPYWQTSEVLPAIENLYTWKGKWYGVLFDADAQCLYYRKDVLADADNQKKFKAKYDYDLPAPPKTMKEMHDIADFFTGWDWNGDGKPDWGIALHAKVNEQGFFHFLTVAAPYVVSKDNKNFWFDPDTMKPLIASEGHLQALEDYVKFMNNGPREMLSWTLGQGWNLFLAGNSVMEPTWGDLPTLAQDPKTSKVQGLIGAAKIPGTTRSYDPIKETWQDYELNQVGNVNGGSWHGVISAASKNQAAAYDFLAFMANRKNEFFDVTHGWTGVQPGVRYAFLPPHGTATIEQFKAQGWNADDVTAYTNAYYENLANPLQQTYLRIPGAAEYWHELDVRVSAVLGGQMKPADALKEIADSWEKITQRYGEDEQKKLYRASMGLT